MRIKKRFAPTSHPGIRNSRARKYQADLATVPGERNIRPGERLVQVGVPRAEIERGADELLVFLGAFTVRGVSSRKIGAVRG